MFKIAALALAAALTGCVVAPVDGYYTSRVYVQPSYFWEPSVSLWYYNRGGHRYYQPRGWNHPRYGHGGYRR